MILYGYNRPLISILILLFHAVRLLLTPLQLFASYQLLGDCDAKFRYCDITLKGVGAGAWFHGLVIGTTLYLKMCDD